MRSTRLVQAIRPSLYYRIKPLSLVRPFTSTFPMAKEYKLKDVSSLDLPPGAKQEAEVEGIEDGKVLLVNAGGKVQALGSKCTHYGAPLAKGVLSDDGARITCPWHGGLSPIPLDGRILC